MRKQSRAGLGRRAAWWDGVGVAYYSGSTLRQCEHVDEGVANKMWRPKPGRWQVGNWCPSIHTYGTKSVRRELWLNYRIEGDGRREERWGWVGRDVPCDGRGKYILGLRIERRRVVCWCEWIGGTRIEDEGNV